MFPRKDAALATGMRRNAAENIHHFGHAETFFFFFIFFYPASLYREKFQSYFLVIYKLESTIIHANYRLLIYHHLMMTDGISLLL